MKTSREIEVFLLRNQGATLGDIARAVGKSKSHTSSILTDMARRGKVKKKGRKGIVRHFFLTGKARAYGNFGLRLACHDACFGTFEETSMIPQEEMKEIEKLRMEAERLLKKAEGIGVKDPAKASELLEASSEKRGEASNKRLRLFYKYMTTSDLRRSLTWLGGGLVYVFHLLEKESLSLDRKEELLKSFITELYVTEMVAYTYWDNLLEKLNNIEIDGEGLGNCLDTLFKESKERTKTLWERENG